MYQPTEKGSRVIEHLEGLKLFLKTIKTPIEIEKKLDKKCAEKLFPYAVALGVEKEWRNKFEKLFNTKDNVMFRISTSDFISKTKASSSCSSGSSGGGCAGGGFGGGGGGGR